jgi:hypothetical protein
MRVLLWVNIRKERGPQSVRENNNNNLHSGDDNAPKGKAWIVIRGNIQRPTSINPSYSIKYATTANKTTIAAEMGAAKSPQKSFGSFPPTAGSNRTLTR